MGKSREIVPCTLALNHVSVSVSCLSVPALLKIEVGQQGLPFGTRQQRRVGGKIAPDIVEPMQLERKIGLEEIKIARKPDLPDAFVDHRVDRFELGKISSMHRVLVGA